MLVPAYNVARLVEYLTRYRLNGATVTAKDGVWSIVRPPTERDPDYTAITIRRDGHAMIYFGDARSCIDAATEVKCGVCTSAIDAERMILNALDTLAHGVYAQARADRDTAASVHTECPACGGGGIIPALGRGAYVPCSTCADH